ncbi:hypothetical protein [Sulfuriroseicoccus oceanibius]|uniref:Organic solvent tolerance-like N-terminal domain-containing protein n=1 Tax=Sulfuriroseicoccus oceanibius TaxID=2707525 RepID=A0A6B3LBK5_9BACT|nr:hypothetical protein [Sulfuriroseicoccus oceanibius]QQL46035.1 hypothetical protein G3M56_005495 [Sulfuriroseicoccus oceanibius]
MIIGNSGSSIGRKAAGLSRVGVCSLLLAALAGAGAVYANDGGKEDKSKESKKKGPSFKGLKMLSVGKPSYGLRIPGFEEDRLTTLTDVEVLTKLDENFLRIEGMRFQEVREDDRQGLSVWITQGIYALQTKTLTSDHDTVVRGEGFVMKGEGCVYSQGQDGVRLLGRVDSRFSSDPAGLKLPRAEAPEEEPAGDESEPAAAQEKADDGAGDAAAAADNN